MSDVSFAVPREYWEVFRAGILVELAWDTDSRRREFQDLAKADLCGYPEAQKREASWEEYRDGFRYLGNAALLLAVVVEAVPPPELPERDIEIQGDPEAIYHALHQVMHKFTAPLTTEALDTLPPEPEKVKRWMGATQWALAAMAEVEPKMHERNQKRSEAEAVAA